MTTFRRQDGQVTVLTAVFMLALLGITGVVLDVGAWFRQQRVEQTTVDAAALAGAQVTRARRLRTTPPGTAASTGC